MIILFILFTFFSLISIIGYGVIFNKFLLKNNESLNLGLLGFTGFFFTKFYFLFHSSFFSP